MGPYPIHDVVVIAVNAAVSAATITLANTCQKIYSSIVFNLKGGVKKGSDRGVK